MRRVRKNNHVSVADVEYKWICLLVNHNFLRRNSRSVEDEARRVFGKDMLGFEIMPEPAEELYAFVKVRDYPKYIEKLRQSSAVKSVLASFENPSLLSDVEVQEFIESATPIQDLRQFRIGDVVRVQKGWLSNLVGMVVGISPRNKYSVLFKFHIRQFRNVLKAQDLMFLSNIFSVMRTPVTHSNKSFRVHSIVESKNDECDKHRPQHRKPGKQKT